MKRIEDSVEANIYQVYDTTFEIAFADARVSNIDAYEGMDLTHMEEKILLVFLTSIFVKDKAVEVSSIDELKTICEMERM